MKRRGNYQKHIVLTEYEIAAMIGYWRCGASVKQIVSIIRHSTEAQVEDIIKRYKSLKA